MKYTVRQQWAASLIGICMMIYWWNDSVLQGHGFDSRIPLTGVSLGLALVVSDRRLTALALVMSMLTLLSVFVPPQSHIWPLLSVAFLVTTLAFVWLNYRLSRQASSRMHEKIEQALRDKPPI